MSNLNRRTFLKLIGQGTAALGMGLSRTASASAGTTTSKATSLIPSAVKYQTFQPGAYFDWERKIIEERLEQARNPKERTQGAGIPGGQEASAITEESILSFNKKWDPYNPLFNDREYAKKAGYPGIPAFPCYKIARGIAPSPIPKDIADKWYYANDGSDVRVWTRVFAGDTFTSEPETSEFTEMTVPGSDLRMFLLGSSGKMFNAKGTQVGWSYTNTREAYRKIIDGSPAPSFSQTQEEWYKYLEGPHYTTDEEWEYIRKIWKEEYIRGSQKLYWEDVEVGDEPTMITTGPISYMDQIGLSPQSFNGFVMRDDNNWANRSHIYRDRFGQYLDANLTRVHYGGSNIVGHRMVMYNNTCAYQLVRLVTNYIGDSGLVTRVRWRFKQFFKEMHHLPFQGGDLLDKVPYMKGKYCTNHPSEGDTVLGKGYVTDKYINERGEYTIDLVCWAETFDQDRIIEVIAVSAMLPSKKG